MCFRWYVSFKINSFNFSGHGIFDKRARILHRVVSTRLGGFALPLDCLSKQVTWFHNNPLQTSAPVKIFHEHVLSFILRNSSSHKISNNLSFSKFEPRKKTARGRVYLSIHWLFFRHFHDSWQFFIPTVLDRQKNGKRCPHLDQQFHQPAV